MVAQKISEVIEKILSDVTVLCGWEKVLNIFTIFPKLTAKAASHFLKK